MNTLFLIGSALHRNREGVLDSMQLPQFSRPMLRMRAISVKPVRLRLALRILMIAPYCSGFLSCRSYFKSFVFLSRSRALALLIGNARYPLLLG